ncbi:hypothetical protein GCM10017783_06750 [Deinococcus piscis]|uniref:Uncharacterized protein n=1 Tax=Deinococcus piscis TaxID=394230 RepID=A0ABQ3JZV9_9DEIO|nr:hypothetical protein GCM10017783_06750 [Deinococcus piscis]
MEVLQVGFWGPVPGSARLGHTASDQAPARLVNIRIPKAFQEDHHLPGLIAAPGFLVSPTLSKLGKGRA